jgi:ketosteroid isomerase-like protein
LRAWSAHASIAGAAVHPLTFCASRVEAAKQQEERMSICRRRLAATVTVIGGTLALIDNAAFGAAPPGDEAEVGQAVESFRKAMLAGDRASFEKLCALQMSYGHSGGKVQTKDEFIAGATSEKSHWKTLEFVDVKNAVAGDNAISRFVLKGENESEGKVNAVNIGVLMVWQRQEGAWKLLARQAFRL